MFSQMQRAGGCRWAVAALLAGLLLAALPVVATAAPAVTLDPPRGPCSARVVASGVGFTPNILVSFVLTVTIQVPCRLGKSQSSALGKDVGQQRW